MTCQILGGTMLLKSKGICLTCEEGIGLTKQITTKSLMPITTIRELASFLLLLHY